MTFTFQYIKTQSSFRETYLHISEDNDSLLAPASRWGAFFGLFGLGSNEFFLVTTGNTSAVDARLREVESIETVRSIELEPTARPTTETPVTREGLYVFRFFGVLNKDVERIAELSAEAWTHFEVAEEYQAEPQGLFCEVDRSKQHGLMLLVTWYDGLNSWQISRNPPPEAAAHFRERATLTHFTKPFATRLLT